MKSSIVVDLRKLNRSRDSSERFERERHLMPKGVVCWKLLKTLSIGHVKLNDECEGAAKDVYPYSGNQTWPKGRQYSADGTFPRSSKAFNQLISVGQILRLTHLS
ncbi:hypothetical protein HYC85_015735 [Camellia sinensis]|uniref:Uncharacterized protein n=1 Tax=Camellia sinensis TaxID=4442 RepID=A0A7J7GYR7_CAMSI|nr:hypothetical protein HYC85_015735 [Camellia sinensis]